MYSALKKINYIHRFPVLSYFVCVCSMVYLTSAPPAPVYTGVQPPEIHFVIILDNTIFVEVLTNTLNYDVRD